jgi:hypothetical protein
MNAILLAARASKAWICCFCLAAAASSAQENAITNRHIDYEGFLKGAVEVGKLRQQRRVTEQDFIRLASEPRTIILDARSAEKFRMLHLKGARHLSLPDFTEGELAKIIPSKATRVLLYCNNNFENEPVAFPSKALTASLNPYTFNALHSYGYTNVFELGPLIDIRATILPLEGDRKQSSFERAWQDLPKRRE